MGRNKTVWCKETRLEKGRENSKFPNWFIFFKDIVEKNVQCSKKDTVDVVMFKNHDGDWKFSHLSEAVTYWNLRYAYLLLQLSTALQTCEGLFIKLHFHHPLNCKNSLNESVIKQRSPGVNAQLLQFIVSVSLDFFTEQKEPIKSQKITPCIVTSSDHHGELDIIAEVVWHLGQRMADECWILWWNLSRGRRDCDVVHVHSREAFLISSYRNQGFAVGLDVESLGNDHKLTIIM